MNRVGSSFLELGISKLWLWLRYKNDIFFIWAEGEVKLEGFLNHLNNFHPNLKFIHKKHKFSVKSLDVCVSTVDNKLETDLYYKQANYHRFFHFNSAHPFHI